jgi:hypothetical protein
LLRREERERGRGHQPVGVTLLREFALHEGLCIYIYIYTGDAWWWCVCVDFGSAVVVVVE